MQNQMATNASNNDIAASASNTHRDKRSKMDTKVCFPVPNPRILANVFDRRRTTRRTTTTPPTSN
jgi:hypothetical protein